MRVRDVMTHDVTTVPVDAKLRDVAELLGRERISGAPVLDRRGRLVRVVSETDLVEASIGSRLRRHGGTTVGVGAQRVKDVMSRPAVVVEPDRHVAHAATVMTMRRINRLPVVESGRLVGIVTRADLVRAFLRDDDAIREEIWSDVVLRGVFVNPRLLALAVADGEVTITGSVETRGKAERLVDYIERVPGVTAVHAEVTWHLEDRAPKGVPPAARR